MSICFECLLVKAAGPGEACEVQSAIPSRSSEPCSATSVSWPAALSPRDRSPKDKTIPAHDAPRGEFHALVSDKSVDTCVDHIGSSPSASGNILENVY